MLDETDQLSRLNATLGSRYRLERELGQGGMATVYLAHDLKHDRDVALKVLRPELAAVLGAERFLAEIRISAQLDHPHILTLIDSGEADGFLWYVLPYVRGESLRRKLEREHQLAIPEALAITKQIAGALAYAHRQGVIHRDIKPENILLQEGEAVLTDFGIALAVKEAAGNRLTETGLSLGTPRYMSPEQATAERQLDARSDVYSLGAVLYEMLTGDPPHSGSTAQAVIAKLMTERPTRVRVVRDTVPEGVDAAVAKALAKAPADRFESAGAFGRALEAGAASLQVERSATGLSRRKVGWLATGVAAALLLIAAVVFWPRGYRVTGDPRHSLIIFPFENRTGDAEYDWLADAAMNSMGLTMAHWEDLRVYDDERTLSLIRRAGVPGGMLDFAAAQHLAQQAGVGTLVLGDVRREGRELVFEAKVHDVASGERLSTEIVRTPVSGDPRSAFDSLSARILRVSGAEPGERPGVVAQTTHSLEAYRAYLTGTTFLQQFQLDSAERYLGQAIALDSTFALAYLQLRNADGWKEGGGDPSRRRALLAKAEQYGADLPPRFRSLVQFYEAYSSRQYRQARAIMARLIARDSTDVEAWYQLGEATYHDGATLFPHPDTLGNLGRALAVFQHVLALDSSYTIAYRHAADLLALCAAANYPWACLPDSAVYGMPWDLAQRYGESRLRAARERARTELAGTLQAWITATPASPLVREQAIDMLVTQGMWGEARTQLAALRALAGSVTVHAEAAEAQILLAQRRYPEAADTFAAVLARASPAELAVRSLAPDNTSSAFLAAGRVREAGAAIRGFFDAVPDSSMMVGGVTVADLRGTIDVGAASLLTAVRPEPNDSVLRLYHRAMADSLHRVTQGDTARMGAIASSLLMGLFWTRMLFATLDTTFTTIPGIPVGRPAPKAVRAVLRAVSALQRGDTSAARRTAREAFPADRHVPGGVLEFAALYLWGRTFAELGDRVQAVQAYGLLDSAPVEMWPELQVLSWAERGALYQALGDTTPAIEMYGKFIDAWRDADPDLQPLVERARRAVAALKGEVAPEVAR